jgi:segregation and condensation protein A
MPDLKVQSEVFEGPLDLLLYLVKKQEVDIYEVNLTQLATRFLEYIEVIRELDLEIAGEFLVMAATLVYIKSRELLPVEQQAVVEDDDDANDPRWELIRKLVEYKKFKDAAAGLQAHEARQEHVYGRIPPKMEFEETALPQKPDVSIFDLIGAVSVILKRIQQQKGGSTEIYEDKWSVSEKIELVRQLILDHGKVKYWN